MTATTTRRVRVPGKLMLAGEYAVLTGAPAIVTCVDRYVSVGCEPAGGPAGALVLAGFDGGSHAWTIVRGAVRWASPSDATRLVDAVMAQAHPESALRLVVDSSAFYEDGRKLGLGSSAAVAVALATALAGARAPVDALPAALAAHRAFQGGAGSGADVRAVAHGGTIAQVSGDAGVAVERLEWPAGLSACAVMTDRAADTVDRVGRFAHWREGAADAETLLQSARSAVQSVVDEWRRADPAAIIGAMEAFTVAIGRIDRAAGLGYFEGGHDRLAALAARHGCHYKPCGAGGGDFGIAIAGAPGVVADFARAATRAGYRVPGLEIGRAAPEATPGPAS